MSRPDCRRALTASISPVERYGEHPGWLGSSQSLRENRRADTDAAGIAVLPEIWAGQRLRVDLALDTEEGQLLHESFEHRNGDQALRDEECAGEPLVVAPGSERTVRVELAARHRFHGRVLGPDQRAFPEPWVRFFSLEPFGPSSADQTLRGDSAGRFELELFSAAPIDRLLVTAADEDPIEIALRRLNTGARTRGRLPWSISAGAAARRRADAVLQPTLHRGPHHR
jgi:hypothetical protein